MFETLDLSKQDNHIRLDAAKGIIYFGVALRNKMKTDLFPYYDFAYNSKTKELALIRHIRKTKNSLQVNDYGYITSPRLKRALKNLGMTENRSWGNQEIVIKEVRDNSAIVVTL